MNKKTVKDIDVKNKRVIVRVDFNVPLDEGRNITDDSRIKGALPTIQYLIDNNAKIILMSHLGRPKGKVKDQLCLIPVAKRLGELLKKDVKKLDDCVGDDVAEDMFNSLHSRIKNRFGEKGLLVMISSPRYVDDFIERKMKEAETNKRIFSRRKKLWDSKPASFFSGKLMDFQEYKIPAEFEIDAKRNPDVFKRDYMAIASLALEPYFKEMNLVEKCIDETMKHPIDKNGKFEQQFRGTRETRYYIHIDLSLRRDATGFAMTHNEGNMVIVDLMLRIKAPPNGEISFSAIRDMIYELQARGFYIAKVTYDGWQSIDSIQILQSKFISCDTLSVDRDTRAYDTLKERIYDEKIKYYRYEPFLQEIRRLELIEGKKVDHPPINASKDVTDAVAGAVLIAVEQASRMGKVYFV